MSNNDERLEVTELGNEKSQRWETKSDTDGNFPGDTDRKFLSEERKSMTHVSGDTVGNYRDISMGNTGFLVGIFCE